MGAACAATSWEPFAVLLENSETWIIDAQTVVALTHEHLDIEKHPVVTLREGDSVSIVGDAIDLDRNDLDRNDLDPDDAAAAFLQPSYRTDGTKHAKRATSIVLSGGTVDHDPLALSESARIMPPDDDDIPCL